MARKSRKETAAVAVQEADAACRAAIYVRLSVEDTHTHSVSIETQQMIIARYLEQYPEISVYDTYIDNGATGTNFHRPGFQQMLSDIEAGHVNCVIVKDLSRLGRNTIDTGYYIEQYFRIRNIRFIAVNENFDTVAPEDAHSGIIIPLRNMINEAYALDIGRKIRAQQRQAMKDGKFIGARTPYGYLKAEDDCHQAQAHGGKAGDAQLFGLGRLALADHAGVDVVGDGSRAGQRQSARQQCQPPPWAYPLGSLMHISPSWPVDL